VIRCDAKKGSGYVTVTFTLSEGGLDDQAVAVVGDFNEWDPTVAPMVKKGRQRTATVIMPAGRRYAFRYLSEEGRWWNDNAAHAYEPNEFGVDNSILDLSQDGLVPASG